MVSPGGLSRSIRPGCQQRPQLVALPSSCLSLRAPESSARQTGFPALLAGPLRWALPASTPPLSQVCACTSSLFLQMPVALCLQNLSATEAPVLPWLRFPSGPYGPPSSPSHLSSCLGPGWGSSEHCWEKPLARTLVEQKLLTSSFLPSRGGTVTFSKAAQGPDGSWRWILP